MTAVAAQSGEGNDIRPRHKAVNAVIVQGAGGIDIARAGRIGQSDHKLVPMAKGAGGIAQKRLSGQSASAIFLAYGPVVGGCGNETETLEGHARVIVESVVIGVKNA